VKDSKYPISPRVAVVPLYNPVKYAQGQLTGSNATYEMVNFLGFFIDAMSGDEVTGHITPVSGIVTGTPGATPGAFPVAIRLVK
jgi:hypothetical protein